MEPRRGKGRNGSILSGLSLRLRLLVRGASSGYFPRNRCKLIWGKEGRDTKAAKRRGRAAGTYTNRGRSVRFLSQPEETWMARRRRTIGPFFFGGERRRSELGKG